MRRNQTHLSRAARKLSENSDLSYAQALSRLRSMKTLPDLGDPIRSRITVNVLSHADEILGCAGLFAEGYTDDDINETLGALSSILGLPGQLVCVWDAYQDGMFTGSSEFYYDETGQYWPLDGPLAELLLADGSTRTKSPDWIAEIVEALAAPGHPVLGSMLCPSVELNITRTDDKHNCVASVGQKTWPASVAEVDAIDPTDWTWAIVAADKSILDRFESEQEAYAALPSYLADEATAWEREDWKYEVSNGDTRLGLGEWLLHRLEAEDN